MHANAQAPAGAESLANALGQHDDALLDGGVSLDQVDTNDGDKIVGNVFGDSRDQVVNRLGGGGGLGGSSGTAGGDGPRPLPSPRRRALGFPVPPAWRGIDTRARAR